MDTSTPVPRGVAKTPSLDRAVLVLYLISLALLPWAWFPPFPWLHEHAQWSDAIFAATSGLWVVARWRARRRPQIGAASIAIAFYLIAAILSHLFSTSGATTGAWKVLGIGELCMLAVITSDLTSETRVVRYSARVVALTALLVAATAATGLVLFYAGVTTPLIGIYGELTPSPFYARVQAGFYNPNLLASFCIFAAAAVGHRDASLPPWLRRASTAALWITVGLTFSRGIIGFALAAVIRKGRTRPRRILAATCAIASVGVMASLTICKLSLDPTHPFGTQLNRSTSSSRYQTLTTSLQSVIRNPIFGTGPDTHPARYFSTPFDSHMTYIGIAATLGLPALASFTSLICLGWLARRRPTELSSWGGMVGLAVDGLGQDIESFRHLWVLIGLCLGSSAGSQVHEIRSSGTLTDNEKPKSETAVPRQVPTA